MIHSYLLKKQVKSKAHQGGDVKSRQKVQTRLEKNSLPVDLNLNSADFHRELMQPVEAGQVHRDDKSFCIGGSLDAAKEPDLTNASACSSFKLSE